MKVYLIKDSDIALLREKLKYPEEKMKDDSRLHGVDSKEERTCRWHTYVIESWLGEITKSG